MDTDDDRHWRAWLDEADAGAPLAFLERAVDAMQPGPVPRSGVTSAYVASVATNLYFHHLHALRCDSGPGAEEWPHGLRPQRGVGWGHPDFRCHGPRLDLLELAHELRHMANLVEQTGHWARHQLGTVNVDLSPSLDDTLSSVREQIRDLQTFMDGPDVVLPGDLWGGIADAGCCGNRNMRFLFDIRGWADTAEQHQRRFDLAARSDVTYHIALADVNDVETRLRLATLLDPVVPASMDVRPSAAARVNAAWRLGACLKAWQLHPGLQSLWDRLVTSLHEVAMRYAVIDEIVQWLVRKREAMTARREAETSVVEWIHACDGNDGVGMAFFSALDDENAHALMCTCRTLRDLGRAEGRHTRLTLRVDHAMTSRTASNAVWEPPRAQRLQGAVMRVRKQTPLHMRPRVVRGLDHRGVPPSRRVADLYVNLATLGGPQGSTALCRTRDLRDNHFAVEYRLCRRMIDGSLTYLDERPAPCRNEAARRYAWCQAQRANQKAQLGRYCSDPNGVFTFDWEGTLSDAFAQTYLPDNFVEKAARIEANSVYRLPGCPPLTHCDPTGSATRTFRALQPMHEAEGLMVWDPKLSVGLTSLEMQARYPDPNGTDRMVIEAKLHFGRYTSGYGDEEREAIRSGRRSRRLLMVEEEGPCNSKYVMTAHSEDFVCVSTHPDPARATRQKEAQKASAKAAEAR